MITKLIDIKFKEFIKVLIWILVAPFFSTAVLSQTITPITWNMVGLDSNNVTVGPNVFPIGARICNNTGSATSSTTWQAKFNWVTTSSYITRTSLQLLPVPALAVGACQDVFHEITVTRNAAAYDQKAQYNIEVVNSSGASLGTPVKTPANREIYVEHLVSQNRNAVDGYSYNGVPVSPNGSVTISVGQTFDLELQGHTATQGYEQLEKFILLNPAVFRVNKVTSTYSASAGTDSNATNKIYADGCGWQNDITATTGSWTYHNNGSCLGAGKYGGTITQKYNITVLSNPGSSVTAGALIYDFSGSSYHYNSDYSSGGITFVFGTPPVPTIADVGINKSVTATGNGNYTFNLAVTNYGPADASSVVVTDVIPDGYTIDNQQNWTGFSVATSAQTITWTIGTLANGVTTSLPVKVNRVNNGTNYVNTATVSSANDPNSSNNSSSAVASTVIADIALSKTVDNSHPVVGGTVVFTIKATNLTTDGSTASATGVVVSDSLPSGYTYVSSTVSAGTYSSGTWAIGSLADGATATLTITATVNGSGSYLNTASVTSTSSDPVSGNNSASSSAEPTYLSLTKTTSSTFSASGTGSFTVIASKTGNANLGTITLTDLAPIGMTITSLAPASGWSCSGSAPFVCTIVDNLTYTTTPVAYPTITVNVTIDATPPARLTNFSSAYSSSVSSAYAEATQSIAITGVATIDAVNDGSSTLVPAATGSTTYDLLSNDTLSGSAATIGTSSGTISAPTLVNNGGLTGASIDSSGQLVVPNNTLPGTYSVTYQICSYSSPSLCDTAIKTVVVPAAEVVATLTGFATPALPGGTVTGTATCTNTSTVAALNASCAVTGLPAGATVSCTPTSPQASLAAGASMVCSVSYTAPASGSTVITVTTSADNDGNPANNTATTTVAVNVPTAEVQASISGFSTPALPGSTVTGTATCTNTSTTVAAFNATCTVTGLPAGATVSCTPTSPQTSLAAGASIVCSVSFTAPASGSIVITVTTSADNDVNSANNTATTTVAVNAPTVAAIPTLSEWAMIFLASLMGMGACLRKRNHAGLR